MDHICEGIQKEIVFLDLNLDQAYILSMIFLLVNVILDLQLALGPIPSM